MSEKITLPDGREVEVARTHPLLFVVQDELVPFSALHGLMADDSGVGDVRMLIEILYSRANSRLFDIARAIDRLQGEVEILFGWDNAILDARLVPKEVEG